MNPIGHIDLRVNDLASAVSFYDVILPPLGYIYKLPENGSVLYYTEGKPPGSLIWMSESKKHQANENRIAFLVSSREMVDQVSAKALANGAIHYEEPGPCPEYGKTYYASYFEDPCGNRLEIYHTQL